MYWWPLRNGVHREAHIVSSPDYLPHIDLILQALRINRERLNSRSKIAIDARLLRGLLQALVATMPFDAAFYRATYPDIAEAADSGQIPDLRQHFVDSGYFEGRFGVPPPVDEAFYTTQYRDIGEAVLRGDVASGAEHYLRSGAAEGRLPNAALRPAIDSWMALLRDDAARG
jgi:hypothetical protein